MTRTFTPKSAPKSTWTLLGACAAVLALSAPTRIDAQTPAKPGTIHTLHGTVSFRERMMLPEGATLSVALDDIGRADAPATTLSETTYTIGAAPPPPHTLPYTLTYTQPPAGGRYALQARIVLNGHLLFMNDTWHAPDWAARTQPDILVRRVQAAPAPPVAATPAGAWTATAINGAPLTGQDKVPALTIEASGKTYGSGGCNRLMSSATIAGSALRFSPVAATQMACAPDVMATEDRFLAALAGVRNWSRSGDTLSLLSDTGAHLVVLTRAKAAP